MPAAGFVFLVSLKNIFMELYYSFSALIVLSAIFSYLNSRFLKLPPSIGVMVIALMVSLGAYRYRQHISADIHTHFHAHRERRPHGDTHGRDA
jgi:hypothetical protein